MQAMVAPQLLYVLLPCSSAHHSLAPACPTCAPRRWLGRRVCADPHGAGPPAQPGARRASPAVPNSSAGTRRRGGAPAAALSGMIQAQQVKAPGRKVGCTGRPLEPYPSQAPTLASPAPARPRPRAGPNQQRQDEPGVLPGSPDGAHLCAHQQPRADRPAGGCPGSYPAVPLPPGAWHMSDWQASGPALPRLFALPIAPRPHSLPRAPPPRRCRSTLGRT